MANNQAVRICSSHNERCCCSGLNMPNQFCVWMKLNY